MGGAKDGSGSVGDKGGGETPGQGDQGVGSGMGTKEGAGEKGAGSGGSAAAQAAPGAERFIWEYDFPGTGVAGSQRGRILESLMGVPWRDNTEGVDRVRGNAAQQIKSTSNYDDVAKIARAAGRDAEAVMGALPGGGAGLRPQAVIVTPTDAPQSVDAALAAAHNRGKVATNALPPEHVRGLPGPVGVVGKALTGLGGALAGYAFVSDVMAGDAPMAVGDGLSTVGGGLEVYAIASGGGTVLGVSAVSAGLVLGGAGIAIGSGISAYRSFQKGDTAGGIAGVVGVLAGLAIIAGVVFGAPLVLAAGLIGAACVGLFHLARWIFS
jgi:hypothetical protein